MASINDKTLDQQLEIRKYCINSGKLLTAKAIGAHPQDSFKDELDTALAALAPLIADITAPSTGGGGG